MHIPVMCGTSLAHAFSATCLQLLYKLDIKDCTLLRFESLNFLTVNNVASSFTLYYSWAWRRFHTHIIYYGGGIFQSIRMSRPVP